MKKSNASPIKMQSLKISHINQLTQKLINSKLSSPKNIPINKEITELNQKFHNIITKKNIFTDPLSILPLISTTNKLTKQALLKKNHSKEPFLLLIKTLMTKTHFKLFIIQYKFRKEIQEFIRRSYQLLHPN